MRRYALYRVPILVINVFMGCVNKDKYIHSIIK